MMRWLDSLQVFMYWFAQVEWLGHDTFPNLSVEPIHAVAAAAGMCWFATMSLHLWDQNVG